jgi:diphthine synthase
MFYLIGLGLNVDSMTRESEKILKKCSKIYLENYTIDFPYDLEKLKEITGKVVELGRDKVESEEVVLEAKNKDVALLVYGSPLIATTHISLILRAEKEKIPVKVIHNASIFDSISETGLQSYKFGKIASMPSWKDKGKTLSFVDLIKGNMQIDAHSLILVDMGLYLPQALDELEEALKEKKLAHLLNKKLLVCSQLGYKGRIVYGKIDELRKLNLKLPICFIIPGKMHFLEEEALRRFEV